MQTIAIYGVGLIGGSFALAVRAAGFARRILGVSSPATLDTALHLGVIDEAATFEDAAARADLIYFAQPIFEIIKAVERIDTFVRPGTLITDAGSTKAQIVEAARKHIHRGVFVGGHPMAGKETRGVAEAEAALFRGRPYVLTPTDPGALNRPDVVQLTAWIAAIGARLVVLSPEDHDRTVAYVSHLPQLMSTGLASLLDDVPGCKVAAGPAVTELTRLALSPIEVWSDILKSNATHIDAALEDFIRKLQCLKENLTTNEMDREFGKAAEVARSLRN